MEEIDLLELFSYFIEKIGVILITIIICLLCGLGYTLFLKEPMYKSDVNVIVVNKEKGIDHQTTFSKGSRAVGIIGLAGKIAEIDGQNGQDAGGEKADDALQKNGQRGQADGGKKLHIDLL